nr:reverse transcriptase domain-containing protein [Tanacetum cinerariifolium]
MSGLRRAVTVEVEHLLMAFRPTIRDGEFVVGAQVSRRSGTQGLGVRERDLIYGGMFVTKLARSFGILTKEMVDALSVEPRAHIFKKKSLITIRVIIELDGGHVTGPQHVRNFSKKEKKLFTNAGDGIRINPDGVASPQKRDTAYQRQVFTRKCVFTISNKAYSLSAIVQIIYETSEKIVQIKSRIQTACDRQDSYVDGKLNPRYIRPFTIIVKVGTVAYCLELPEKLSRVHSTLHVSNLKKCLTDEPLAIPLDEIQIDEKLHFIEEPFHRIHLRRVWGHRLDEILFDTIPTTIPDTTPTISPPATHTVTTEIPTIVATTPLSPDYTPASPDYSPAPDTEFDPSEVPPSDHIPPLPAISPFLSSTDDTTDSDTPDTPPSPTHDHSSPDLPSTFVGPSRKRRRSPMTSVPVLSHVFGALSPIRADLIPSPKRVRDSGYLAYIEVDPKETSLRDDVIVRVEAVDREENKTGMRGLVKVRVERVTHPMMPEDTIELAQEERAVECTYETLGSLVVKSVVVTALTERIAKLEKDKRRLRGTTSVEGQRVDRIQRGMSGHSVARAYTAGNNERKGYVGSLPYCNKCRLHHEGPCTVRCGNCKRVGHQTRDYRSAATTLNTQRAAVGNQPGIVCYECGRLGHFRKDCLKLRNQNRRNQTGNNTGNKTGNKTGSNKATAKAYAIGGGANPDFNAVTDTFLLNNCYASMSFDSGPDRSFVSSTFSALLDVAPSTLDTSYAIELADGRISKTYIILRGCTLGLLGHPFDIDLMPVELGNFDIIIGMD